MKISNDQLVAVGRLLSTQPKAMDTRLVATVEVGGETVSAGAAIDAFEAAQKAAAAPPGRIERKIHDLEAVPGKAEKWLNQYPLGRYIVDHTKPLAEYVKPADPYVEHTPVTLHYADGSTKELNLDIVDNEFNRKLHNMEIGAGVVGAFIPFGSLTYVGLAVANVVAAGNATLEGQSDKAHSLWQASKSNVFRAISTAVPIGGSVVNAYVIAQEHQAKEELARAATVGQVTGAGAAA